MTASHTMPVKNYQITNLCHEMAAPYITPGSLCIDATMGNGYDTLFLCEKVGETGRVLAFDIQKQALQSTTDRLKQAGMSSRAQLFLESHEKMADHAQPGTVSLITFNLGYLPGGDHACSTHAASTIPALMSALELLKIGGAVSLCIYSGGDTGYDEKNAVLTWLKALNPRQYLVLTVSYFNRPGDPPMPVLIVRLK